MDLGGDMGIDPAHVPSPPFHHHTGRARMWSPRGHWRDHPQPARGSRGAPDSSAPPAGWPDGPTGRIADWLDGGRLSRAQKPIEGLCGTSRYPWEEPLLGEGVSCRIIGFTSPPWGRRSLWGWIWGAIWASTLPTCPPHPFITTQGALGCGARGAIGEIIHNPPGAPGAHRIHLLPLPDGRMGLRAGLLIGWMADCPNPGKARFGRGCRPHPTTHEARSLREWAAPHVPPTAMPPPLLSSSGACDPAIPA